MKKQNNILLGVGIALVSLLLIFTLLLALELDRTKSDSQLRYEQDAHKLSELGSQLTSLNKTLEDRDAENSELKSALADVEDYFINHYSSLVEESEKRTKELEEVRKQVSDMVDRQKEKPVLDLGGVHRTMQELETYIEGSSPLVRVVLSEKELEQLKKESEDEDTEIADHRWEKADAYIEQGKKVLADPYFDKLTLDQKVTPAGARAPKVAVYYEDILTGYKYSYNGDSVFDCASVMKAPYITAILDSLVKYEQGELEISEKDSQAYSEDRLLQMFDLDASIILDKETMGKPGSRVLEKAEDGTEYTYRQLIEFSLKNSDNTAFALVREHFTNKWYFDYVREKGARSPLSNYMKMTVDEAGSLYKGIYYFTLENPEFGSLVREHLTSSAHTVLSKSALRGSDVAHKYGWDIDAYHDAAIVYGERPYIAIVFTDIDSGGADADRYVCEIFKRIEKIHNMLG